MLQTEYVFAAVLSPDQLAAQAKVEVKKPDAVHDVLSVEWLRDMDAANAFVDIM